MVDGSMFTPLNELNDILINVKSSKKSGYCILHLQDGTNSLVHLHLLIIGMHTLRNDMATKVHQYNNPTSQASGQYTVSALIFHIELLYVKERLCFGTSLDYGMQ